MRIFTIIFCACFGFIACNKTDKVVNRPSDDQAVPPGFLSDEASVRTEDPSKRANAAINGATVMVPGDAFDEAYDLNVAFKGREIGLPAEVVVLSDALEVTVTGTSQAQAKSREPLSVSININIIELGLGDTGEILIYAKPIDGGVGTVYENDSLLIDAIDESIGLYRIGILTPLVNHVFIAIQSTEGTVPALLAGDNTVVSRLPKDKSYIDDGSLTIQGGSTFTNKLNVVLTLKATNADEMYITNTNGCSDGGSWTPFETTKEWNLPTENSLNTVFVRFRNSDITSSCFASAIIHDGIKPDAPSALSHPSQYGFLTKSPQFSWKNEPDVGPSGLHRIELAIGRSPGAADIVAWHDVGLVAQMQLHDIDFSPNQEYFPSLRSVDVAGNQSTVVSSSGWIALSSCDDPYFVDIVVPGNLAPRETYLEDVNGDDRLDYLAFAANGVEINYLQSDGVFASPVMIAYTAYLYSYFTVADMDNDGDIDLLAGDNSNAAVHIFTNNGAGTFSQMTVVKADNIFVGVSDFDQDGINDLVFSKLNNINLGYKQNDGNYNFDAEIYCETSNIVGSRCYPVADINQNGILDFFAPVSTNSTFYHPVLSGGNLGSYKTLSIDFYKKGRRASAAGDLDGDGDIDIVGKSFLPAQLKWFENDGAQNFTMQSISTRNLVSATVVDIDADGDQDIIGSGGDSLYFYKNSGTASFVEEVIFDKSNNYAEAKDFDNDGDIDIAVSHYGTATKYILEQRCNIP